MEVWIRKT
ncbi:hypothetical protein B4U80_05615, partial [Leptotrombidium deliense]